MNCRRVALSSIAGLALVACSPATIGLGDSGAADGSGSDSETDAETDDNGEGSEADAGTDTPGDGDGDPTDDESESESPTSDDDSSSCGDGILDPGEECDGSELDGMDCAALGYLKGDLSCGATCSFNTAGCLDAVCGDGVVEGSEECDGMNLNGVDCVALGFGIGKPTCTNACVLDSSACPSPGEGQSCGLFNECPNNLECVDGKCYDGSLGDPCDWDWDCQNGLSCKGPWGSSTCQP